jgi:hypothetical protein
VVPSPSSSSRSIERDITSGSSSLRPVTGNLSQKSVIEGVTSGTSPAGYTSQSIKENDNDELPKTIVLFGVAVGSEGGTSDQITLELPRTSAFEGELGSSSVQLSGRNAIHRRGSQTSLMKPTDLEKGSIFEFERSLDERPDNGKHLQSDQNPPNAENTAPPNPVIEASPVSSQHRVTSLGSSFGDEPLAEAEPQPHRLFRAFPEKGRFRSIPLAIVGFSIMTLLVLGNLIYTFEFFFCCADI